MCESVLLGDVWRGREPNVDLAISDRHQFCAERPHQALAVERLANAGFEAELIHAQVYSVEE